MNLRKITYGLYLITIFYDNPAIIKIRSMLFSKFLDKDIKNLVVRANARIYGYKNLVIGNNVSINHGCFLSCQGGLYIGDNVAIGHNTSILTTEHSYEDMIIPIKYQPLKSLPVSIGHNVWIGANVTILAGVSIANGTVIAAGAVVTKNIIDENIIVGGVPAKYIKRRNHD